MNNITLFEQLKNDFNDSKKNPNREIISAYRVILAELSNKLDTKNPNDDQVLGVLRQLYKSENQMLEYHNKPTSDYLEVVEGYLPVMMDETEIKTYILDNFDLGSVKNTMQLMKPIMANLKGKADGNLVREILEGK